MAKEREGRRGISKFKLILVLIALLLLAFIIIRLSMFFGSIAKTHLNDDGLTHAKRFNDCIKVHGIDVSEHQDDINWKKVKSGEADFAFVRAAYRKAETGELVEDEDFEDNIKEASKAGIMVGAYVYSQALNAEEAEEEAEFLVDLVKRYDIVMPLVIDYEIYGGGRLEQYINEGNLPASSMYHDIVLAFCEKVEKEGYESLVYANYDMLTNYMDSKLIGKEANIWAAQYGGSCDVTGRYMFWQCAEDAKISGVEGNVDHDIWYIEPGKVYKTKAKGKRNQTSIADCKIEFEEETVPLKNHRAKPKVVVTYDGKKLKKGKHYEIGFVKNTEPGTAYAIVRGIGKYKDWTSAAFKVE